MDYESTEKPKNKPLTSPYRNMFYMVVVISIVSIWAGSSILQNFTPSDKHMSSPEFFETELETLSEDYPEILDVEWAEYSDREITIWLEDTYEQTHVEDLLEIAQSGIGTVAPELEPYVQLLADSPDMVRFVAFDRATASADFMTNIIITRLKTIFDFSALSIAEATINNLPGEFEVYRKPIEYELEGYDVASIQWSFETSEAEIIDLVYIIAIGDIIYSVNVYTTPERVEYDQAKAKLFLQTLVIDY
jgi:hypothetical protein